MSDIFEIVGVDASLKIKVKGVEKVYQFTDPNYLNKMALMKEMRDLGQQKDGMDEMELATKDWELQKKYVQLYVPDLQDSDIEGMGEHAFRVLFESVTNMSAEKFGAYVKKVDSEKKNLATPQA